MEVEEGEKGEGAGGDKTEMSSDRASDERGRCRLSPAWRGEGRERMNSSKKVGGRPIGSCFSTLQGGFVGLQF